MALEEEAARLPPPMVEEQRLQQLRLLLDPTDITMEMALVMEDTREILIQANISLEMSEMA